MPTKLLAAQISAKDIAIAAYTLGMQDASRAEVVKCCILIQAGQTPDNARREVLGMRKPIEWSDDTDVFGVKVPEQWVKDAENRLPNLSPSQLFRYSVLRVAESHSEALKHATEPKRGWPQGRPRKTVAA